MKIKHLTQHFIVLHLLVEMIDHLFAHLSLLDVRTHTGFLFPVKSFAYVVFPSRDSDVWLSLCSNCSVISFYPFSLGSGLIHIALGKFENTRKTLKFSHCSTQDKT